jgi:hypothetical protein
MTTLGTHRHALIVEGVETDVAGLRRLDVIEEVVFTGSLVELDMVVVEGRSDV